MSDDRAIKSAPASISAGASTAGMPAGRPLRQPPIYRELPSSATQPADLELAVSIEIGRVWMKLADVMALEQGAVIQLDKLAGDPVDIVIHEQLVARGEVVVVDGKFAVRILSVTAGHRTRD